MHLDVGETPLKTLYVSDTPLLTPFKGVMIHELSSSEKLTGFSVRLFRSRRGTFEVMRFRKRKGADADDQGPRPVK